ncbi:MAG: hypothetical protein GF383_13320 [Candidatus Lokiarchaeota archaeon]|nr:hypothetical protein [Candidatus Lokiarchaeota archaeon]MBD3342171.1 hypothetical protein [Candidatus Lokiarchaeota archaeon]
MKPIFLKCIIDDRERKLIEIIDKRNETAHLRLVNDDIIFLVDYKCKRLDVADIVVSKRIGIERKGIGGEVEDDKTSHDFSASIKDNRLISQLHRLKQVYPLPILLLEGFKDKYVSQNGLHLNAVYGYLSKIVTLPIPILPTNDIEESAVAIERLAFREQIKKKHSLIARSRPKNLTLKEERSFFLEGMLNTGPKIARMLINYYKTPAKVIKALKDTKVIYTKTGNVKGIKGPLNRSNIRGIGPKFILKNQKLLFGKS